MINLSGAEGSAARAKRRLGAAGISARHLDRSAHIIPFCAQLAAGGSRIGVAVWLGGILRPLFG